MHSLGKYGIYRNITGIIALLTAAIGFGSPIQAFALESAIPRLQSHFAYKQYHIHYELNGDGTYKEIDEIAMTVLTNQGVEMSRLMPIGMPNMPMSTNDRNVEVLTAYTSKKNGERIDATPQSPPTAMGMPTSGVSASVFAPMKMKVLAFQQAQIGDTLVFSFSASQNKPVFLNNIILNQAFPKFVAYEDVVINLSAPESLQLRVETFGVEKGRSTLNGHIQNWEWRYQNKTPVSPQSNQPPSFDRIHISTFMDNNAEMEAMSKQLAAFRPPMPEPVHCQVFPSNDGPDALAGFAAEVSEYFWRLEDLLKREINDWNTPTCVFDDGRPRVTAMRDGYNQAFGMERDWSKSLARVEYLKKKFPNEAFATMAEARYWNAYAWDARGGGYSSSISDDGRKLFRERLEKAERILLDTKTYAALLPDWYDEMISVQSTLDRPEDERDKIFLEGVKRYPAYYPIYFTMLNYLLPKWGGTWRTVDNMIQWSVEHTQATEGTTMYARLYWVVGSDPDINLFKDTFASWPKMKGGFEDLMTRHPKSKWNLNNFAKFACMAGDKQTFLALRAKMSNDVIDAAWPQKMSLDLCETKFGYTQ